MNAMPMKKKPDYESALTQMATMKPAPTPGPAGAPRMKRPARRPAGMGGRQR